MPYLSLPRNEQRLSSERKHEEYAKLATSLGHRPTHILFIPPLSGAIYFSCATSPRTCSSNTCSQHVANKRSPICTPIYRDPKTCRVKRTSPLVRENALKLLQSGSPRLVAILAALEAKAPNEHTRPVRVSQKVVLRLLCTA